MEISTIEILLRLVVAVILGSIVGIERTMAGKNAGMRTFALVSMGSALFIVISEMVMFTLANPLSLDPLRIASQIVVGIGFIGAGLVFHNDRNMKASGLTSAAGLWVAAGIGMACGYGLYAIGIIATLLTLLIFTLLWYIEKGFKKVSYGDDVAEKENSAALHE